MLCLVLWHLSDSVSFGSSAVDTLSCVGVEAPVPGESLHLFCRRKTSSRLQPCGNLVTRREPVPNTIGCLVMVGSHRWWWQCLGSFQTCLAFSLGCACLSLLISVLHRCTSSSSAPPLHPVPTQSQDTGGGSASDLYVLDHGVRYFYSLLLVLRTIWYIVRQMIDTSYSLSE